MGFGMGERTTAFSGQSSCYIPNAQSTETGLGRQDELTASSASTEYQTRTATKTQVTVKDSVWYLNIEANSIARLYHVRHDILPINIHHKVHHFRVLSYLLIYP